MSPNIFPSVFAPESPGSGRGPLTDGAGPERAACRHRPFSIRTTVAALLLILAAVPADGQTGGVADLSQASIEDLMKMRVTSASRKEQRAEDVPAAVYVITREQIRRSGLTLLPEILRLAPGVHVAQVNGVKWAVSIRGFNDMFANKLLVLIDGRTVYSRAFGGVFWEGQDVVADDIERIEVIRGPGAAMWGANAVNGVINVITRSARETRGLLLNGTLGTYESMRLSARYGGSVGSMDYRIFGQSSDYRHTHGSGGGGAGDDWNSFHGGTRIDWTSGPDEVVAQAHVTAGTSRPLFLDLPNLDPAGSAGDRESRGREWGALTRWKHTDTDGSSLQLQGFTTNTSRRDLNLEWRERIIDGELQYENVLGGHAVIAGLGLRRVKLTTDQSVSLYIGSETASIFNAFGQDDISIGSALTLSLGAKAERDTAAGWALLPSARVIWHAPADQHLWAGVSRARRTPSSADRTLRLHAATMPQPGLRVVAGFIGNPDYRPENLTVVEAGYRLHSAAGSGVEVTVFRGAYEGLHTGEPQPPVLQMDPVPHLFVGSQLHNLLDATTRGIEVNGQWRAFACWRVTGAYTGLWISPTPDALSLDQTARFDDGHTPKHVWQVHSVLSPRPDVEIDMSLYRAGSLRVLDVPGYTRLDARMEWKLTPRVSAVATARNLLDADHVEFSGAGNIYIASWIPRSALVQLRWR